MARLIPGAQLLSCDSENRMLLADEPAWPDFARALQGFLVGQEHKKRREPKLPRLRSDSGGAVSTAPVKSARGQLPAGACPYCYLVPGMGADEAGAALGLVSAA